jgi:hypothetical protein
MARDRLSRHRALVLTSRPVRARCPISTVLSNLQPGGSAVPLAGASHQSRDGTFLNRGTRSMGLPHISLVSVRRRVLRRAGLGARVPDNRDGSHRARNQAKPSGIGSPAQWSRRVARNEHRSPRWARAGLCTARARSRFAIAPASTLRSDLERPTPAQPVRVGNTLRGDTATSPLCRSQETSVLIG